jgi:hypothetical protein
MKTKTGTNKADVHKNKDKHYAKSDDQPILSVASVNGKEPVAKILEEFHRVIIDKLNEAKKEHKVLRDVHCYSNNNGTIILYLPS